MCVVPNLNIGWRTPRDGRIEKRVEVLDLVSRAARGVWPQENSREGSLRYDKLRRRHVGNGPAPDCGRSDLACPILDRFRRALSKK